MSEKGEISRKDFIKEKLTNFILFIKKTFGENNILLNEFAEYIDIDKRGYEPLLMGLLQICNFLYLPMDNTEKLEKNIERLNIFLKARCLDCGQEEKVKMLRYFDLFHRIF